MTQIDTSNAKITFAKKEVVITEEQGLLSRNIVVEKSQLHMSEVENKFIMMSRIAVLLNRKGITSSLYLSNSGPCSLMVHFDGEIVESLYSWDATEEELLNWWSIIEG